MELLRSLLFIPADSAKKRAKVKTLRPDAFIYDLEDAVAPDNKLAARKELAAELDALPPSSTPIFVRVNGAKTAFQKDDLRAAVHPRMDGLVLPKSDDPAELRETEREISALEQEKGIAAGKTKLLLIIETVLGVVRAGDLAACCPRIIGMAFGSEDYCADIGVGRTRTGEEIEFPRSMVAIQARAHQLHAIDTVFVDFHDAEGFFQEARRGKQLGYTGKALIHPSQIEAVHRAFAPADHEVNWAKRVIEAYEAAKAAGVGVVAVDQKMIDEPILTQAKKILHQHEVSL
ncbi:MAG: HpcH/HpaI aldolase/citrate lyase family protein [Terriglobia bacterium]